MPIYSLFVNPHRGKRSGKTLLMIGRFEPSSKICNHCGYHNKDLTLKQRSWICPDCGSKLDRDVNAAINIKRFALMKQNTGQDLPGEPVEIESDILYASIYEAGTSKN